MAERLRLLVSVRSVAEARLAAEAGVDFIDLKEPGDGALGGLDTATIATIVAALPAAAGMAVRKLSATIGDTPDGDPVDAVLAKVRAVAACGVDYVKVGIARRPSAAALLAALADCGAAVIPVFVADLGLDAGAVRTACSLGFAGVMVDTADKRAGSLFDVLDAEALRAFVGTARAAGTMVGVAGALQLADLPRVAALAPDYAGFRSAVCRDGRAGSLDAGLLAALCRQGGYASPRQLGKGAAAVMATDQT